MGKRKQNFPQQLIEPPTSREPSYDVNESTADGDDDYHELQVAHPMIMLGTESEKRIINNEIVRDATRSRQVVTTAQQIHNDVVPPQPSNNDVVPPQPSNNDVVPPQPSNNDRMICGHTIVDQSHDTSSSDDHSSDDDDDDDEEQSKERRTKKKKTMNLRELVSTKSMSEEIQEKRGDTPGTSKTEDKPHMCPQCKKRYKNKGDLTTHMRVHDENKRFPCQLCQDKFFATKQKYNQHMLSHTGEKPHECPICKRCFGNISNLKTHQLHIHMPEKTFKCPECPVATYFQSPNNLSNHMLLHKEKQHKCSICHKEFHTSANLKRHKLVHTKVKAFECGICEKRFTTSGSLKIHTRSHEETHKCKICDTDFNISCNFQRHMKNCATRMEKRQHKCSQCRKRFGNKSTLRVHIKTHDKETTN